MESKNQISGSKEQALENKNIDTADHASPVGTETPETDDSKEEAPVVKGTTSDEASNSTENAAEHPIDKKVADTPDQSNNEPTHPEVGTVTPGESAAEQAATSTTAKSSETDASSLPALQDQLEKSRGIDGDSEREAVAEK